MTTALNRLPARDLARVLRERDAPGRRSEKAIRELRKERALGRPPGPIEPVTARIGDVLSTRYLREIQRRGGEIGILVDRNRFAALTVVDRRYHLALLHVGGWRYYTRRQSHRAALSYVCGVEDGQVWAVRIPGTIVTLDDALDWVTPAEVKKAEAAKKKVVRQGDVYVVETSKRCDGKGDLPDRHLWDAETRTLTHPEHELMHLPYPVRFVAQRALGMGRGGGTTRVYGD
jgi:hypothetical protein